MKPEDTRLVSIGFLKPNPWRHYLGEMQTADVDEIEESISTKDLGWWGGIVGRQNAAGEIELGNGHRRVQALLRDGKTNKGVQVKLHSFSDAQMLQVLAQSNTFKACTNEERLGVVRAAINCLTTKPEECQKLLPNSVTYKPESIGPSVISQFLGEKAWPQQRVSELLKAIKDREAQQNQSVHEESIDTQNSLTVSSVGEKPTVNLDNLERLADEVMGTGAKQEATEMKGQGVGITQTPDKPAQPDAKQWFEDQTMVKKRAEQRSALFVKEVQSIPDQGFRKLFRDKILSTLQEARV
jgi:hypothetical protein